ncbi:hypothetical protein [Aeromonas sp. R7-1]|uniref:hypothetical protein n=1 Tax=Aeromonas sp. R7-1 TaxID=3138473 RepID=UPI0034A50F47
MSNDKINKCKQLARQLKKARAELTHCQRVAIEKPGDLRALREVELRHIRVRSSEYEDYFAK